jgi:hypothetical protein
MHDSSCLPEPAMMQLLEDQLIYCSDHRVDMRGGSNTRNQADYFLSKLGTAAGDKGDQYCSYSLTVGHRSC